MPVVATLEDLDETSLKKILTDPKNALMKRYQRLFEGRSVEKRLSLLKDLNERVSSAAKLSPDDLVITIYEAPGENFSFGRGGAQRANAVRES